MTNQHAVKANAHDDYVRLLGGASLPWWDAVLVTCGTDAAARHIEAELNQRRTEGRTPAGVRYLAVPDVKEQRNGSGGATLNALRALALAELSDFAGESLEAWWRGRRVLVIHAGGESRRLPQWSLDNRLFAAVPHSGAPGGATTVLDQILAHSTAWASQCEGGLLLTPGDVLLDAAGAVLDLSRPGVTALAVRQPLEEGARHGVYVTDEQGRVYTFLSKAAENEIEAAGGLMADGCVALDTGVLYFDGTAAARLTSLAGAYCVDGEWQVGKGILERRDGSVVFVDLYDHIISGLLQKWTPAAGERELQRLAKALRELTVWCCLVEGSFVHLGSAKSVRVLLRHGESGGALHSAATSLEDREADLGLMGSARRSVGWVTEEGVESAGLVLDSVLAPGTRIEAGATVIQCHLNAPVTLRPGAVLHSAWGLAEFLEVPEDTVVHQVPLALPGGRRGVTVRVHGADDAPDVVVGHGVAYWMGRPLGQTLAALHLEEDDVWPGIPAAGRTFWNARLFVLGSAADAWRCARWLMGTDGATGFSAEEWAAATRVTLEETVRCVDHFALAEARAARQQAQWQSAAVSLAESGADIRPLLPHAPGVAPVAAVGRELRSRAERLESGEGERGHSGWNRMTEAAARHYQSSLFLGQAGLSEDFRVARARAFECVHKAVEAGVPPHVRSSQRSIAERVWQAPALQVAAPVRIDFGGGWSDTPPFCLDWGGTVLNMAVELDGECPIRVGVTRLSEPVLRCVSEDTGEVVEFQDESQLNGAPRPGSAAAIPQAALRLMRLNEGFHTLHEALDARGGGLEIRSRVNLPLGSGLGTSSVLSAAVLRGLAEMAGDPMTEAELSDQVMRLEQMMTTGGGWQDQAGGIFPGVKLVVTGPGLRQRLRVEPVAWDQARQREFCSHFVLYFTGLRRMAKNLLAQVVGSYLARETRTVEVLHSIKTLAVEMAYALREGDWPHFGELLDRHWVLNKVLDPHTTNAPIDALLHECRPYLAGAKLAGAGGGGFLMLMARDPDAALRLRRHLAGSGGPGRLYEYQIAESGLRITRQASSL
jgi:fucokinase